ncbi:ABC transporter permease [Amycolatopsis jejuensis]|uniref:ABC transporter permease n=1 Tax=Amycolatopsis jejuensis TaxID=330084 RepID=UPI000A9627F2|nr:ABC transporter permease [Amycolatopsis jejuensis]
MSATVWPDLGQFVHALFNFGTPLLLAALGATLTQRAGVFNVGVEGMMALGAFTSVAVSMRTGNPWAGAGAAAVVGAAAGLLMAFAVIQLRGHEVIVGLGLNGICVGLASYLLLVVFGQQKTLVSPDIIALPAVHVPGLASVPLIGPALDGHSVLVYVAPVLAVAIAYFLRRTHLGISLRSVGDAPVAAAAVGVRVDRMRYLAFAACGALAGLGGAHVAIGFLRLFQEGMTAGLGFIALTAAVAGRGIPGLVVLATLGFATFQEIGVVLVTAALPPQFVQMVPYAVAILALTVLGIVRSRNGKRATRRRGEIEQWGTATETNHA